MCRRATRSSGASFRVAEMPQITNIQFWRSVGGRSTSERGSDSAQKHFRVIRDGRGRIMVVMTHNTDIADSWEREGEDPGFLPAVLAWRVHVRDQRDPARDDALRLTLITPKKTNTQLPKRLGVKSRGGLHPAGTRHATWELVVGFLGVDGVLPSLRVGLVRQRGNGRVVDGRRPVAGRLSITFRSRHSGDCFGAIRSFHVWVCHLGLFVDLATTNLPVHDH